MVNRLLMHYSVDVQHPEVSGAEHLEMLQIRDRLAEIEPTLTCEEHQTLAEADRLLVERASAFHKALMRFLDFPTYRQEHEIPPARWWWYLDVLSHLPPLKDERPEVGHASPQRL